MTLLSQNTKILFNTFLLLTGLFSSSYSFAEDSAQVDSESSITVEVSGAGQPIIFIPGLMSDAQVWQDTAKALGSAYEFHFVSVAGFAGNKPVPQISLAQIQSDLNHYIERKKLTNTLVIGHSMGGFLAYRLALSQPKRVVKVVAVDGLPFIAPIFTRTNDTTAEDTIMFAQQMKSQYHLADEEKLTQLIKKGINIQAKSKQDQERVINMAKRSDPITVGNIVYDLMTSDLRSDLKSNSTPILLLGASGAAKTASQHSFIARLYKEQLAAVSNAEVLMNQNSRHFIMLDDLPWLLTQLQLFI